MPFLGIEDKKLCPPRTLLVASGKGGTGKSTLSAGIGWVLASEGLRVILWDTDFGMRSLDSYLGLAEQTVFDYADFDPDNPENALTVHPELPNLRLLASPPAHLPLTEEEAKETVEALRPFCDILIIDAPAGLGTTVRSLASVAEAALLVATPDPASTRSAALAGVLFETLGLENIHYCANRVKKRLLSREYGICLDTMTDEISFPLLGYVPEDNGVIKCGQEVPHLFTEGRQGPCAGGIKNTALRLAGMRVPMALR